MQRTIITELLGSSQSGRTTLASKLGKKGTSSDVTLYNLQKKSLTIIDPIKYPQNIISLIQFLEMTDIKLLLLPPKPIDRYTAELAIIANMTIEKPTVIVRTMKNIVSDMEFEHYWQENVKKLKQFDNLFIHEPLAIDQDDGSSLSKLQEKIINIGEKAPLYGPETEENTIVLVDHAFPVKGVGTVVLGKVISGTVKKGMNLLALPHKTNLVVRSIQVQDVDVREATKGVRVGLAIKGQFSNIKRGVFLIGKNVEYKLISEIKAETYEQAPYSKQISELKQVHLIHGTNDFPAKVIKDNTNEIILKTEKQIAIIPNLPLYCLDLSGKQRFNGIFKELQA